MDKHYVGFAVTGGLMSIIFMMVVNYLISPDYIWFIYPAFLLMLWFGSWIFLQKRKKYKQYAIYTSVLSIILLIFINILQTSVYVWSFFLAYLVIWWPITILIGKQAKTLGFACIVSATTILYYSVLNYFIYPEYLWVIYPSYMIIWWPLSIYFTQKKRYFSFSVIGSLLTIWFLITVNMISSPDTIWAIYPIFVLLWWPLSMYYFYLKRGTTHSIQRKAGEKHV